MWASSYVIIGYFLIISCLYTVDTKRPRRVGDGLSSFYGSKLDEQVCSTIVHFLLKRVSFSPEKSLAFWICLANRERVVAALSFSIFYDLMLIVNSSGCSLFDLLMNVG